MKHKDEFKLFKALINKLKNNIVLVEGKKDKDALRELGCNDVYVVQSRGQENIEKLLKRIKAENVIILTDIDNEGDRLCKNVEKVCRCLSINTDTIVRKKLAGLIHLRYWENIGNKVNKFIKEMEKTN
ncbi:toprim domain-containing protein [Candidatus Micrarchaeota archaeon]|nr:toprim domain-containing protein [Candidatus Micrarchaeota archaeon]